MLDQISLAIPRPLKDLGIVPMIPSTKPQPRLLKYQSV